MSGDLAECSAATEVTFHRGNQRHVFLCADSTKSLESAARDSCVISATSDLKLLRGGMILDGTTPAILLGGCSVLVLTSEKPEEKPAMVKVFAQAAQVVHSVLPTDSSWKRVVDRFNWTRRIAWDFVRTIVVDA